MPDSALKELPILSDFQLDGEPLLQIYLVGQPEFRKILSDRTCDQLRQRVVSAYHLRSLDAGETEAYVQHRLQQAGWHDDPKITGEAFRKIHGIQRAGQFLDSSCRSAGLRRSDDLPTPSWTGERVAGSLLERVRVLIGAAPVDERRVPHALERWNRPCGAFPS